MPELVFRPLSPAKDDSRTTANPQVDVATMKIVSRTNPVYPAQAKAKKDTLDGPVVFDVTIGKDGSIQALRLKKSLREDYDKSAWDAVKTWRWEPYLLNGEPTEVDTTVTINYFIQHDNK
jgi:TonB family protein